MPYKDPAVEKQKAAERYRKNLEARKAKMREDYLKNREKRLAQVKAYTLENKEKVLEYQKQYRESHKDENASYKREYYATYKEELNKECSERQRQKPEATRARIKKYKSTDKGKLQSQAQRNARRKREKLASLDRAFHKEVLKVYLQCKNISKTTNILYEVDHIIPISHPDVCGLHVPWNLQIIPQAENRAKGNTFTHKLD